MTTPDIEALLPETKEWKRARLYGQCDQQTHVLLHSCDLRELLDESITPTPPTTEIDALREAARTALERATPGEWQVTRDICHFDSASDICVDGSRIAMTCSSGLAIEHDAAAIVAAVNYLRAGGLDEARTLAAEVARMQDALDGADKTLWDIAEQRDTLAAENARLRGALQPFAMQGYRGEQVVARSCVTGFPDITWSHVLAVRAALAVQP